MADAKLNTKQRKALPSGSFCGPNRSFPAPDCKHIKAGLSLLGRYKGPGDKDKIRACLYRKAKSMKCFKSSREVCDLIRAGHLELAAYLIKTYYLHTK